MPVRYSIDLDPPGLVRTTFFGDVTHADLLEHFHALFNDPRFAESQPELVDFTEVTHVSVISQAMIDSARWGLHASAARRAFIAPTDELYGLSRMYQSHLSQMGDDQLAVYRTRPPALAWLGVSE